MYLCALSEPGKPHGPCPLTGALGTFYTNLTVLARLLVH